jgi:hypothetical protein
MSGSLLHRPAWQSRGWMSFTVANGGVLHLGGTSITTPTSALSISSFLDSGIPQNPEKTRFAIAGLGDNNGHTIKHAVIRIVSGGATTDPAARTATNGSTPTTALGLWRDIGETIELHNSQTEIFNFKLFNRSGGNMVVEVEVFE